MSYGASAQATPERPKREIEGTIEHARRLREMTQMVANALHDMRRRLLGDSDPPSPATKDGSIAAVSPEVSELQKTLSAVENNVMDIGRYVESLSRL